jgi:hypothetical protein
MKSPTPGIAVAINHDKVRLGSTPLRRLTKLPVSKVVYAGFAGRDVENVIGQGFEQASCIGPRARVPGVLGISPDGCRRARRKFSQCQAPHRTMAKAS